MGCWWSVVSPWHGRPVNVVSGFLPVWVGMDANMSLWPKSETKREKAALQALHKMSLGSLHSWEEETWWCDKAEWERRPLVKAPSFAFKAPAVYHMNKIITCLLHLDHFKRPFSPPARTHACVHVEQFWAEVMSMQGFNPDALSFPDCCYAPPQRSHLPHVHETEN